MNRIMFKGNVSDIEIWKRVSGHPKYFISTMGRLYNSHKHRICPLNKDKDGYFRYSLDSIGIRIHKLVATHFIPNPNNLETVDHIDNNKHNNNVSNLQWLSRGDNTRKRHENTRNIRGGGKIMPVICIDTLKIYKNAAEAQRDTGCYVHSILECCKNTKAYAYANYPSKDSRLRWRYATESEINGLETE